MTTALHRLMIPVLLLLTALLGMALGQLGATLLKLQLVPVQGGRPAPAAMAPLSSQLTDYEVVVRRNLFDAAHPNSLSLAAPTAAPTTPRSNFTVLGTVTAGASSLALIRTDKETKTFRLGDDSPGGGRIVGITRTAIVVRHDNGSEETVLLKDAPRLGPVAGTGAFGATAGGGGRSGVRAVEGNRYVISRQEAEKARSNINELLKQARLEPNIVDGKTRGFAVKMVRSDSILAGLGLVVGDVVMQVNGVPLDSPEKALQIFQQLREARHISLALERGGAPMTLEYDLD